MLCQAGSHWDSFLESSMTRLWIETHILPVSEQTLYLKASELVISVSLWQFLWLLCFPSWFVFHLVLGCQFASDICFRYISGTWLWLYFSFTAFTCHSSLQKPCCITLFHYIQVIQFLSLTQALLVKNVCLLCCFKCSFILVYGVKILVVAFLGSHWKTITVTISTKKNIHGPQGGKFGEKM